MWVTWPRTDFEEQQRVSLLAATERAQLRAGRPVRTAEIYAELSMHDHACVGAALPTLNALARRLNAIAQGGVDQHGRILTRRQSGGHAQWSVRIQLATLGGRLREHPADALLVAPVQVMRSHELHWLHAAVTAELERRGEPLGDDPATT